MKFIKNLIFSLNILRISKLELNEIYLELKQIYLESNIDLILLPV